MARLTVHLGGSLVAPIATPRLFASDWRVRSFIETGLAPAGREDIKPTLRLPPSRTTSLAWRHWKQSRGAVR
ncbi:MAG: hypothetical protein QOD93_364 [Acetobacteraceae bacterium]|jgi:hypothetical protein|nr:hypothetical protein [Acetobacteraceae bacterium]